MKFEALDTRMRVFETAHDHCVLPGVYIVVRLDGRSFTRNTKEIWQFEAPFDVRFRDLMLETTEHLMGCGFSAIFGYTQSDEISLLLRQDDATFGRKERKIGSILSGEASARFTLALGALACFDARVCQLPTAGLVVDYFRWRHEDAHRNALSAHCYWLLRKKGRSARSATNELNGMSTAQKNELLFQEGINFNELPSWQKRGVAIYWEEYQKSAVNPKTGETVSATRSHLVRNLELPLGDSYTEFIGTFVQRATC